MLKKSKNGISKSGKKRKQKCTRGKKVCQNCGNLVPIHSFECKCGHKFDIKKKFKEDPHAVTPAPEKIFNNVSKILNFDSRQASEMYFSMK